MEHIWTMLMHKILQNHLLCAFVANLKIGGIYALYPESFCDKNLAIRKVFAFCDSARTVHGMYYMFFVQLTPLGDILGPLKLISLPPLPLSIDVFRGKDHFKNNLMTNLKSNFLDHIRKWKPTTQCYSTKFFHKSSQ